MKLQTTIPFSGFYCSLHDSAIDGAIESMFSDSDTGTELNAGLQSRFMSLCDFRRVHVAYATDYTKNFAEEFGIESLKFESLEIPKEYNFTTDRIFCTIDSADAKKIYDELFSCDGWNVLEDKAVEMFSSRSGFVSFYNPNVTTWPEDVAQWDVNQIGCMLAAWAEYKNGDFDSYEELNLMEKSQGNGYFDNWLCAATPGIERLFTVKEYLEKRAGR